MKHMIIDGTTVEFENARNVLEVARQNGFDIPNLCYCENLSIYGGCRMCVVENDRGKIEAACTMVPKDGMEIKTNTAKLWKHRKLITEMLLASHRVECTTCDQSGICKLQEYANRFGIHKVRFDNVYSQEPIDKTSPSIVRDPSKCILCAKCVRMCAEVQTISAIDICNRGRESYVSCGFGQSMIDTNCVGCGQCAAVCPTGALTVKNEVDKMWNMIFDPAKKTMVQIAPAVRVGVGEEFGIPATQNAIGKIVTALKRMGVDYVFDTSLTADLTIVEESNEFLNKVKTGQKLPLFTSCCPGWIKHIEKTYPEIMPQVSTCGSPMEMFGAVLRKQFKDEPFYSVAVMPCSAKKMEAARPELEKDGERLIDLVITSQELVRMIKSAGLDFASLPDTEPDQPLDMYTGGGVIFAVTGGVTEAVIRRVLGTTTDEEVATVAECGVRGLDGIKAFEVTAGDLTIRIAVANGLGNADKLIAKIRNKEEQFDFVEVMACPNGCIGGGGQPPAANARKAERFTGIFNADGECELKNCDQNTELKYVYELLDGREHELLHIHYADHARTPEP